MSPFSSLLRTESIIVETKSLLDKIVLSLLSLKMIMALAIKEKKVKKNKPNKKIKLSKYVSLLPSHVEKTILR